jgi:hypothetical protein
MLSASARYVITVCCVFCLIFEVLSFLISDISRVFPQLIEDNYFSWYLILDLEEYRNDRFGGFR